MPFAAFPGLATHLLNSLALLVRFGIDVIFAALLLRHGIRYAERDCSNK